MYRRMILSVAFVTLSQFPPPGCPQAVPADTDTTQPVRLSIQTGASVDQASADTGQTVSLSASASTDLTRGAVSYSWVQTAGPGVSIINADQAVASFVARSLAEDQRLTFVVTTRNQQGDVGRAEVSLVVRADPDFQAVGSDSGSGSGSGAPMARAGGDRTVNGGDVVTLDGSASTGSGLSFSWTQTFGSPQVKLDQANTARPVFTAPSFATSGGNEFRFDLTVRDDQQRSSRDAVTVRIRQPEAGGGGVDTGGQGAKPRVRFETTMGNFVIELEPQLAPITVENFLQYVRDGFYPGLIFHRVVPGFVVQGGGFTPLLQGMATRDPIVLEADNGLKNLRGSVGMARLNDPDTATSQFYVNLVDNDSLDHTSTNDGFAVFGKVVTGMAVIDAIGAVRTTSRGLPPNQFFDVPLVDILINVAVIE